MLSLMDEMVVVVTLGSGISRIKGLTRGLKYIGTTYSCATSMTRIPTVSPPQSNMPGDYTLELMDLTLF
jgi:hypothetical protein